MSTNTLAEKYTTLEVLTSSPALAANIREHCPDLDVRVGFDIDNQPWFVLKDYCFAIGLQVTADILDILPKENIALVDMSLEDVEMHWMFPNNMAHVYFINQKGADILVNAVQMQANIEIAADIFAEETNTAASNYSSEGVNTSNVRLWSKDPLTNDGFKVGSNKLRDKEILTNEEAQLIINEVKQAGFNSLDPKEGNIHFSQGVELLPSDSEVEIHIGRIDAEGFIPIKIRTPNAKPKPEPSS